MTRQQRLHDLLHAIADWRGARGTARLRARRNAMAAIREFRTFHLIPEKSAFERAVAASKQRGRMAA